MKFYKRIMNEDVATNVPVVSIEKNQVDLDDEDTINEINRNLSIVLSKDFASVGEGLTSTKKILSMYGIELPYFEIKNNKKGVLSTPISQFRSSGESHFAVTPPFYEKNFKNRFTYKYELKDGKYDVNAEVTRL
jgi:hypothetical protein